MGGDTTACICAYPCAGDAECGAGKVCVCGGAVPADQPWSFCAKAACATGADCASHECGVSSFANGCSTDVELACRAATDMCRVDAQCPMPGKKCVLAEAPVWTCSGPTCAIGRPLLVGGAPRTAPAIERGDWNAARLTPDLTCLDPRVREALAAHWLDVAALEHASVASFARFTLELLALGAPAELVAGAQRAGLDEVEHALLAYGLAGAYAERAVGPGALDLTAVAVHRTAPEVVRSLVIEGCVGETLGAAEALVLAGDAGDPALRAVHARIAADEQRHAELSWQALAWLLRGAGDVEVAWASRCFDEAIAAAGLDPDQRALAAPEHGLLSAAALGALRRRALGEVVTPCAAALLDRARRESLAAASSSHLHHGAAVSEGDPAVRPVDAPRIHRDARGLPLT
jgi:hypothetical protein